MSSTESPVSVTFCIGKPAMVTLRADSPAEWMAVARQAAADGMLGEVKNINDLLNGVRTAAQPAAKAQQDQELPDSFGVRCGTCGGATRFVSEGTSKQSGKPYKRYQCTDNQMHKATFTNA